MKTILDREGRDITQTIQACASECGLDPIHLLALLYAESGLDAKSERWGSWRPATVRGFIESSDWVNLSTVISDAWPDIGFGMSQHIVLFHYFGDHTMDWQNVLAVRSHVFSNPEENICEAADTLSICFQHPTCDGTILSAMVVYNAGSDKREDPLWMAQWSQNVRSYQKALDFAEIFREDEDMDKREVSRCLGVIWGISELLDQLRSPYGQELKDAVVVIKKEAGIP